MNSSLSPSTPQIPPRAESEVAQMLAGNYLAQDEKLLWADMPAKRIRLQAQQLYPFFFVLPFAIFFVIVPILAATHNTGQHHPQSQGVQLIPIGFFLIFFLSIAGSIAYRSMGGPSLAGGAGNTFYAVTDQRVMAIIGRKKKTSRSIAIGPTTDIRMEEFPDGLGTITFGPRVMWPYGSRTAYVQTTVTLENIREPRHVFRLLCSLRQPH